MYANESLRTPAEPHSWLKGSAKPINMDDQGDVNVVSKKMFPRPLEFLVTQATTSSINLQVYMATPSTALLSKR